MKDGAPGIYLFVLQCNNGVRNDSFWSKPISEIDCASFARWHDGPTK